jgi:leucyl-tRNA synthetase
MSRYIYAPGEIDAKWQRVWDEREIFRTPTDLATLRAKPKYYVLDMFPYPSGEGLHVGHPKGYTATDVLARMRRMQGYNVLHPMGWDAFGLPAERAAVREDLHPAAITARNIANFKRQIRRLGFSYDWSREISTSAPDYYRWTQWIFLRLFEKDLAYMENVPVNWCPALGTVLSNEEVKDGRYVETGDPVEKRLMQQWMLRITAYAQRLLDDLALVEWPESLKEMQRNWIGRSDGALIRFEIEGHELSFDAFTTRPDTLFGATYCVLAPEHPLVEAIVTPEHERTIAAYVTEAAQKTDLQRAELAEQKTGVFTGAYAINPANGASIPIWVADYVLMSYGTGAIMAVPGHDERDHAFARQYGLPIVEVVAGADWPITSAAYAGDGVCVDSGFLNGLPTAEAKEAMIAWLEANGLGSRQVQYRLRDWLFSRQRYWGEPFPIVHLDDGTIATVPEERLPVRLPSLDNYKPTQDGRPPLARAGDDWLMVTLPDGRRGIRETNTMPQWAGSCWYYLRFIDPHNEEAPWDAALERYWMPVDQYIGGAEHAVLHLLYARFWHKVLFDCGLVSTPEPFHRLFNQGMVQAHSYRDGAGKFYYAREVSRQEEGWVVTASGAPVETRVEKMSKSRYNVVNPDDVIDAYGADSVRLYELFIGPLSASGPWQTDGIEGVYRFLQRVWRLIVDEETGKLSTRLVDADAGSEPALNRLLHQTIQGVTVDVDSVDKMNTAISKLMVLINGATAAETLPLPIARTLLRLLAPFAPHLAEELWARLGEPDLIALASWPAYDPALAVEDLLEIPVQVNGKVRGVVTAPVDIDEGTLRELALAHENVGRHLAGKQIRRVIVVRRQLVNIVVGS